MTAPPWVPKRFGTRVVGVTFAPGYPDTVHRLQAAFVIADAAGEPLAAVLVRDPDNRFDANAIEVHVPALGQMVGHVPAPVATWLAPALDAGVRCHTTIDDVVIHPDHTENPGVDLVVARVEEEGTTAA